MTPSSKLKSASEYGRVLRPLLPPQAFAPDSRNSWRIGLNLLLVCLGYLMLREVNKWWVGPLCAVVIGHSLACLAFLAHDISHNSVVQNKLARRSLEFLLWGLNLIPPTLWRRVHNQTHHVETNTVSDPAGHFARASERLLFGPTRGLFIPIARRRCVTHFFSFTLLPTSFVI